MELIDAETLRRTASFEAFPGRAAVAIDYSADGRRLAVAGEGGGVGVWDVESGEQLGALLRAPRGPRGPRRSTREPSRRSPSARAICSPRRRWGARCGSGTSAGASCFDRRCACLPPCSGWRSARTARSWRFRSVPSPTEGPNGVEILDVGSGERVARLSTDGEVRSVAFSPDGSLLAGGEVDGGALLWATDGWRRVGRPLALRNASTLEVEFSPDGHTLATSHSDHSVALWDVASQEPIGPLLPDPAANGGRNLGDGAIHPGRRPPVRGIRPRGRAGLRTSARDPLGGRSRRSGCNGRARSPGGGLTPEQWAELVPEQDYISVCPSG